MLKANPPACPLESIVGINYLTVSVSPAGRSANHLPAACRLGGHPRLQRGAFRRRAVDGRLLRRNSQGTRLSSSDRWIPVDQHVTFTISDMPDARRSSAACLRRTAGDAAPPITGVDGTRLQRTKRVTALYLTDCRDSAAGSPSHGVEVDGSTDSPDPVTSTCGCPTSSTAPNDANSYLKTAKVTLPEGAGLNPSLANGLDDLHRRAVRARTPTTRSNARGLDHRHDRGGDAVAAAGLAQRHGLRRRSRPATIPSYRQNSSGSSSRRARTATASTSAWSATCSRTWSTGQLTVGRRRKPTGDLQLVQSPHQRWGERRADDAEHLRTAHDDRGN